MAKPGQHRRPGPSGNELGRAVNQAVRGNSNPHFKAWATPTAWLGRRLAHATGNPERWHNPERSNELSDQVAATGTSGALNPTWVEWLMNFPLGWTEVD